MSGEIPGRRDNGLQAGAWGALVDLDPRLSEALLASLATAGVAAYVEPAGGLEAFSRAASLPDRPLDRLFVDPAHADAAREVVGAEVAELTLLLAEIEPGATAHGFVRPVPRTAAIRVLSPPVLPGPGPAAPGSPPAAAPAAEDPPAEPVGEDPDAAWKQIVEGFGRAAEHPVPPWPVSEDVDPPPGRTLFPSRPERSGERRRRRSDEPAGELPDWVEPAALDDDGHYVPPPPPPVPRIHPRMVAGVAAILLGLLLLFVPSVIGVFQLSPGGVFLLGLASVVGGAVTVVLQMRDAPPTDSGPDDGAVV